MIRFLQILVVLSATAAAKHVKYPRTRHSCLKQAVERPSGAHNDTHWPLANNGVQASGCAAPYLETDLPYWDQKHEDYTFPDKNHRKSIACLQQFRKFIVAGTLADQSWDAFGAYPLTRFDTLKHAFGHFEMTHGKIVVELGTSRSFTHGGITSGVNNNDDTYWHPNRIQDWDWGAGAFTTVSATCLGHMDGLSLTSVDLAADHVLRSKKMTAKFPFVRHECSDSVAFLENYQGPKIDLLYMDTADVFPIEPSAKLHLQEAQVIVRRDLLADDGIILIDDVLNQTPVKLGERGSHGKSKYSIPFFEEHGYSVSMKGYQYILRKKKQYHLQPAPLNVDPFKVLHVGYHAGTKIELDYVASQLGWEIDFWAADDPVPSGNNKYNVNHERAGRMWTAIVKDLQKYDLVIVSDTSALARVFLQHHWPRRLIVWVCNRFDYAFQKEEIALMDPELERLPYPDDEFFNLIRSIGYMQGNGKAVVGYTAFENYYAKQHQDTDIGNITIIPTGFGAALPNNKVGMATQIPSNVDKKNTFFIPPYHNDERLPDKCKTLGIACYRGRYAGAMDIADFRAVIHVPYAWSNMALFEAWKCGIVYIIPSKTFLLSMEDIFWSPPYDKKVLDLSEWYRPEHRSLFVFFDSWDELKAIVHSGEALTSTLTSKKALIAEANKKREKQSMESWRNLAYKL